MYIMGYLLVQSCSDTKKDVSGSVSAFDLYEGYFFKIIKKAFRTERIDSMVDILVLSAKYGVVEPDEKIEYYDKRMGVEQAKNINNRVIESISRRAERGGYNEIWINMGEKYRKAIEGLEKEVSIPVDYIEGSGIGEKGSELKNRLYNISEVKTMEKNSV